MTATLEHPPVTLRGEPLAPWDQLKMLREPFPPVKIGKLPKPAISNEEWKKLPKGKCRICDGWHATTSTIHLDFVGHADITERLLDVDPEWNWKPMAVAPDGGHALKTNASGQPYGLWIELTVAGVTRIGFGSVVPGSFDAEKQLIGDALRNAGMRFGMALDLWRKDFHIATTADDAHNGAATETWTMDRSKAMPIHESSAAPPSVPLGTTTPGQGSLCVFCSEMDYKTARGLSPKLWIANKGPAAGFLQCDGRTPDGGYANHPAPVSAEEEIRDDSPVPF